jgi:cytochrome c oxidase assembly protein subunit 11
VSPARAADYLNKIECFCFQKQPLQAGEAKEFPLVFFIDPDLPEDITKLTLSYTLFDISDTD